MDGAVCQAAVPALSGQAGEQRAVSGLFPRGERQETEWVLCPRCQHRPRPLGLCHGRGRRCFPAGLPHLPGLPSPHCCFHLPGASGHCSLPLRSLHTALSPPVSKEWPFLKDIKDNRLLCTCIASIFSLPPPEQMQSLEALLYPQVGAHRGQKGFGAASRKQEGLGKGCPPSAPTCRPSMLWMRC